jgi:hypothetical protein
LDKEETMATLDPKKVELFKKKVIAYVTRLQTLNLDVLETRLSDNTVLKLPLRRKAYHGKKEICRFWERAKDSGLTKVEYKFDPTKIRIRPADFLMYGKSGYLRYDMIADVYGTCNLIVKTGGKLTDPEGAFDMTFGHQWECPAEPLGISLGV